jgi:hypothetical protein
MRVCCVSVQQLLVKDRAGLSSGVAAGGGWESGKQQCSALQRPGGAERQTRRAATCPTADGARPSACLLDERRDGVHARRKGVPVEEALDLAVFERKVLLVLIQQRLQLRIQATPARHSFLFPFVWLQGLLSLQECKDRDVGGSRRCFERSRAQLLAVCYRCVRGRIADESTIVRAGDMQLPRRERRRQLLRCLASVLSQPTHDRPPPFSPLAGHGQLLVLQWLRAQNPPCPWDDSTCSGTATCLCFSGRGSRTHLAPGTLMQQGSQERPTPCAAVGAAAGPTLPLGWAGLEQDLVGAPRRMRRRRIRQWRLERLCWAPRQRLCWRRRRAARAPAAPVLCSPCPWGQGGLYP